LATEDSQDPLLDEPASLGAALGVKHIAGRPELLEDVQQVENEDEVPAELVQTRSCGPRSPSVTTTQVFR
jgi:hypothetical protein